MMLSSFFKGSKRTVLLKKNVLASFAFNGGSVLVSFILVPMTLNYLNEYEYGVWLALNTILSWIYYFDIGLGNGLRNKLTEALATGDMTRARIYVSTSFVSMGMIACLLYGIFYLANCLLDWYSVLNVNPSVVPNLDAIMMIVFGTVCITFVFKLTGSIYMAYQLPAVNNLLTFLGSLVSLILITILMHTTSGSLRDVAIAFTGSTAVIYILAYPVTFLKYKELTPSLKYVKMRYFKSLALLGVNFMLIQLTVLVVYSTSNVLISRMFGPEEVTPYNIAYKLFYGFTMVFNILLAPLWSAITDAYVRGDYTWIHRSVNKMQIIWLAITVCMVLVVTVADFIYKIWIGDAVDIPFRLTCWVAVYTALSTLSNLYTYVINGFGKLRILLISALIQGVVYLPMAIWLGRIFGVTGILMALSLLCLLSAIVNIIQCRLLMNNTDPHADFFWNK